MSNVFECTIPMRGIGKERPRLGKFGVYTPKKTNSAENILKAHFRKFALIKTACSVEIEFYFAVEKKKLWGQQKPTRPDLDNSVKLVLDAMNGTLLKDDGQIVELTARKFYSRMDLIKVTVRFDSLD